MKRKFKNFSGSFVNATGNPSIVYQDPVSGIYRDIDGTWYLKNGTPLNDFDQNTGAYQEEDGTWYTFQGLALKSYDKNTGAYQEEDGTWYDAAGNEIAKGSSVWNQLTQFATTILSSTPAGGKAPANQVKKVQVTTASWVKPVLIVGALAAASAIIYFAVRKK